MSMKTIIASLAFASLSGLSQAQGQTESATINFRVIVPEMLQSTAPDHPNITMPGENKESLTITHNLAHLCLSATTANHDPAWEMKVAGHNWQVTKYADSYKLCTYARGHVPLEIIHTFGYLRQPWPVRLTFNPM